MSDRTSELQQIAERVRVCTRCPLYKSATHPVPGEGPANAEIMLIGEAPGFHEDQQGRPFVGASGRYLEELLAQIGLKRSDIFITNVVKHRPPENRDPMPEEIEACRIWLDEQIELIRPQVIVTISRFAMARWFPNEKITVIHGKAKRFGNLLVVPMFHPAAALRNQNLKPVMVEDFKKLPKYIADAKKNRDLAPPDEPKKDDPPIQQLKMF
ncbi:MAG: uracil-DNA glycosylase [Anaerolineae bacterium]|nr:uracil-DNA glycosylase [Anaerolineae bacterium]